MTNTGRQEAIKSESAAVFLHLVKIDADGADPLYFVDNTQQIIAGGIQYEPCAFRCVLPDQNSSGAAKACRIEIDNVDRRIAELVAQTVNTPVYVTITLVMAQSPDAVEAGPLRFILRNVSVTKETVQAELYDFYLADRNLPGLWYSPNDFPGLFAV